MQFLNEILGTTFEAALARIGHVLMTLPSEATPAAAVILAPFVAVLCLAFGKLARMRRFRYRRAFFAVLSKRYLGHRSHVLDVLLLAGNIGLFGLVCAQATVSITAVSTLFSGVFSNAFGPPPASVFSPIVAGTIWFAVLFVAYELAYWTDHFLSHKIPFLWEFHKVHHSAEVLSPLTNFRVHPIDSLVFVNIVSVITGLVIAVLSHLIGPGPVKLDTWSWTIVIGLAVSIFSQFQHTHIWLPLTGIWGRVILSPAHHQIHHSVDVRHHDKNMGNLVAIFDWLFGTLYLPTKKRQKLVFGLDPNAKPAHDLQEGLVQPFVDAGRHLLPHVPQPLASPTQSVEHMARLK